VIAKILRPKSCRDINDGKRQHDQRWDVEQGQPPLDEQGRRLKEVHECLGEGRHESVEDDEHGEDAEYAKEGTRELDGRGDEGLLQELVCGEHDAQRHDQVRDAKNLRIAYQIQFKENSVFLPGKKMKTKLDHSGQQSR
jgi:hypothetical protein